MHRHTFFYEKIVKHDNELTYERNTFNIFIFKYFEHFILILYSIKKTPTWMISQLNALISSCGNKLAEQHGPSIPSSCRNELAQH